MKITIVIPIFACTFSVASAQTTQPKTLLEIVKEKQGSKNKLLHIPNKVILRTPKAKLLTIVPNGKIYELPLDKIPCLVPDKSTIASIPVKKLPKCGWQDASNMFKPESIIPQKEASKIPFIKRNDEIGYAADWFIRMYYPCHYAMHLEVIKKYKSPSKN